MKTEVVRVRLTELEKQKFTEYAEGMSMSISDYIKYCCLIEPPKTTKERMLDFMNLRDDAKELRKTIIARVYEPNEFARFILDTPSARWEEDGVYNLSLKYSKNILQEFVSQVKEYLNEETPK